MALDQIPNEVYKIINDAQASIWNIAPGVFIEVRTNRKKVASLAEIIDLTYKEFRFPRNDDSRKEMYVLPRFMIIYSLKTHKAATLKQIGEAFGGKDHSTIVNAITKAEG